MPTFQINTNVPIDKIPDTFEAELVEVLHKQLFYPPKILAVQVHANQRFYFGHSREPFIAAFLNGVGRMSPEDNKGHSVALTQALSDKLRVKKDRIVIYFNQYEAWSVGLGGQSVATIPGFAVPTEPQED